ncbi:DUF4440 domain-containing protein [Halobacillus litoralis]|uniref:DUF4440 domain-containing protein n=1 Tax=Halobacillus litoralis TaxID=45668 RepID=A0A845DM76_9BACI|nr:DUF4440 domain-containing protein [Halobacillus litoralis]MYL18590.1 DUF4440 domain-containing protein [Halobacillus litoralis]
MNLYAHLYQQETELLTSGVRSSREELDRRLADDFQEISSTGSVFGKDHVLERLPREEDRGLTCEQFQVQLLAEDAALTTFLLHIKETGKTSWRSSIWKKYGDTWKMVHHQGTPTPK